MEALNAAGLTPVVSVLSDRKTKNSSNHSTPRSLTKPASSPSQNHPNISINGGLTFLSSVLTTASVAKALTYEEALGLGQTVMSPPSSSNDGIIDSIVSFGTENIALIFGGATLLAIPLVLSKILNNKPKSWGVESAKTAYAKLGEIGKAQLLDIRAPVDVKASGRPDIKGLKKKVVSVVYKGEDKPGFLQKLSLKFKDPENTTLFILDKFDGSSELVAELVTENGFKAAYAIKDGADGPKGWTNSGLPWILPKKSFDFGNLGDTFSDALEGAGALPVTLGLAAASGLSLLAFTEVETILQLLGSAAIIQFVSKKFLYAQDRKQTLQQVDEYLNNKIAPKDLVDEIKQIGKALLPELEMKKSLPAPTQIPDNVPAEIKVESAPAEPEAEVIPDVAPTESAPAEPPKPVGSLNGTSRPLSPYPYYPDFKPPASPSPSKP